ncbi:MAG: hypothetical protein ACRDN0_13060 [Trebonia sp.]
MFGSVQGVRFTAGYGGAAAWRRAVALRRALAFLCGLAWRRQSPSATAAPRRLRPVIVPRSLAELRGPASGVIELPVRLYWSGSRRFDLADPHQAADLCEAVLDTAATADDLTAFLNAGVLVRAWPILGMSRVKREAWESRFPVLRGRRLAPAA